MYLESYLIDQLLKIESKLDGCQRSSPFLDSRAVNSVQQDTTTAKVLVLDELLGVFILLFSRFFKELGESLQGDIITIVIGVLQY